MKKPLFYIAIIGLILFEISNVYFIMPMPGSQEMNSIDLAYFLNKWQWVFRGLFLFILLFSVKAAFNSSKWFSIGSALLAGFIFYETNFEMAADAMFLQPQNLLMKNAANNEIDTARLIIGIEKDGAARAYPIQFLGYHHQVLDTLAGEPIIATYCTVCRTGRVFSSKIDGKNESFRLVGMDHFNAMFEDAATKSWWRQATGECIAGPRKGQNLAEIPSQQTTLGQWLRIFPTSKIMKPDAHFRVEYDSMSVYEKGRLTGNLTRYDTLSWQRKSWIAGVEIGSASKAFDWNRLKKEQILNEMVEKKPVLVALAADGKSLFAFERTSSEQLFSIRNDTLFDGSTAFDLLGREADGGQKRLRKAAVYQEYWHSWQTFHPQTEQ